MRPATLTVLMAVLGGCVHDVRPRPQRPDFGRTPLPLKVKYHLPPGEVQRVDSHRYFNFGYVNEWNVDIGEGLAASVPAMLEGTFASVSSAAGPTDVDGADLLVSVTLTGFELDPGTVVSTVKARVLVLGPDRRAILEEELQASAREAEMVPMFWATFAGEASMRLSSERALERLMQVISVRLCEVAAASPAPMVMR